eukprot:TRINITY_DN12265_c0_g1_i1.p1 TRINITY_DN12265_c0_g1~~TRINITY_DN12265_c0_g1_i1.p1  ORF type:complete len:303 (-),score=76.50 TRINITY_DN12265_c0_g1_i1:82-990(-)
MLKLSFTLLVVISMLVVSTLSLSIPVDRTQYPCCEAESEAYCGDRTEENMATLSECIGAVPSHIGYYCTPTLCDTFKQKMCGTEHPSHIAQFGRCLGYQTRALKHLAPETVFFKDICDPERCDLDLEDFCYYRTEEWRLKVQACTGKAVPRLTEDPAAIDRFCEVNDASELIEKYCAATEAEEAYLICREITAITSKFPCKTRPRSMTCGCDVKEPEGQENFNIKAYEYELTREAREKVKAEKQAKIDAIHLKRKRELEEKALLRDYEYVDDDYEGDDVKEVVQYVYEADVVEEEEDEKGEL